MADQGYPDFQRVVNWDGGLILDATIVANPDTVTDLGFVGRYAYLAFYVTAPSGPVTFQVAFYADAAKTKPVGIRRLTLDPLITEPLQFKVPCIGPWATLDIASISGASRSVTVRGFGTNRQALPESWPRWPTLLTNDGVSVPASSSRLDYLLGYWDGPMGVLVQSTAAGSMFSLQYEDLSGTWHIFWAASPGQGVYAYQEVVCPLAPVRLGSSNNAAAGAFLSGFIVPSLTGG